MKAICCCIPDQANLEVRCEKEAEYEIIPNDKNPIDNYTHACAEHLEQMLDDSMQFTIT